MENKLVKINNVELGIKEYKKERVVTAWDIAKFMAENPEKLHNNLIGIKINLF